MLEDRFNHSREGDRGTLAVGRHRDMRFDREMREAKSGMRLAPQYEGRLSDGSVRYSVRVGNVGVDSPWDGERPWCSAVVPAVQYEGMGEIESTRGR